MTRPYRMGMGEKMSETKHTPGQWEVLTELFETRIIGTRNGKPCLIAGQLYDEENEPELEELEANAKAISAVPDLIAICLEIANDGRVDLVSSERRMRLYNTLWKAGVEL